MLKRLGQWILRAVLAIMVAFLVLFAGDWTSFKLRGSPQSTVTVNRMMVVPLKNNKVEYYYMGTFEEPCSISLFPQGGNNPCWQLRRHPNQNIAM